MITLSIQRKYYEQLINKLAGQEPLCDTEYGNCMYCCKECDATRSKSTHELDCSWVEARELLGDKLPE
jgi:hypothetical protein